MTGRDITPCRARQAAYRIDLPRRIEALRSRIADCRRLHEVDALAEQICYSSRRSTRSACFHGASERKVTSSRRRCRVARPRAAEPKIGQLTIFASVDIRSASASREDGKESVHDVCPDRHCDTAREFDASRSPVTFRAPVFIAAMASLSQSHRAPLAAEDMFDRPRTGPRHDRRFAGMLGDGCDPQTRRSGDSCRARFVEAVLSWPRSHWKFWRGTRHRR